MIERERLVLIGHPVSHSLSPVMYNAALEAAGRKLRYETLDVPPDALSSAIEALALQNSAGNFTLPHKKAAFKRVAQPSALSSAVGAVNTFWRTDDGVIAGDNTDVAGFNEMVREELGSLPETSRVAVIGAGGAASAVLTALESWSGATASVHARDLARATSMRMRHPVVVRACSMRDPCLEDADLVVNATPIGLSGEDAHPVELSLLARRAVVVDLVYGADETAWVRAARERGHTAFDGLSMLLHQGVAAWTLWFGVEPDRAVMWEALRKAAGRV